MASCGGCFCFQCVREMEAGILEDMGKFSKVAPSGLTFVKWPLETIRGRVSLQTQSETFVCETKTKDNVFVQVEVSVQYRVIPESAVSAFYKLTDHRTQIKSYVFDVIRSQVPRMELDTAFESKSEIADAVKNQLAHLMIEYGYEILVALITELTPEPKVKNAMNEINASARMREAAKEKAEAEKILSIKAAEADAESKYLSGLGIARQRKAIVDGLRETVTNFSDSIHGTTPQDVMDLLLLIQYFDVMKDITGRDKQTSLFLPHGPGSVMQMRQSLHAHVKPEARKLPL